MTKYEYQIFAHEGKVGLKRRPVIFGIFLGLSEFWDGQYASYDHHWSCSAKGAFLTDDYRLIVKGLQEARNAYEQHLQDLAKAKALRVWR